MRSVNVENSPTFIPVVAAAIVDGEGRLLLQQALPGKPHAGQWEFPGGKVEPLESPRFALCREICEELALKVEPEALMPAGFAEEQAERGRPGLVLMLYTCRRWSGPPQASEGQRWAWFTPVEAASLPLARMDRALLEGLARRVSLQSGDGFV